MDLGVEQGVIHGLLGPNGSGKTTTIEMIVGLRRPTSGRVRTLGLDPVADRDRLRRLVAVQPQKAAVFEQQTIRELLTVWAAVYDTPGEVGAVLDGLGLGAASDTRIARLSGGQQQRVLVGLALVARPTLLVLDEPSTGLDPNARTQLREALIRFRDDGGTILLSTHDMHEAALLCERVAVLDRGRLVAEGGPRELVDRHAPWREIEFTVPADRDLAEVRVLATEIDTAPAAAGEVRVRMRTTEPDRAMAVLVGHLGARQLEMHDAGLDAVFRALTGRRVDESGEASGGPPDLTDQDEVDRAGVIA